MIRVDGDIIEIKGHSNEIFNDITKLHLAIMGDEKLMQISADAIKYAAELAQKDDEYIICSFNDIKEFMKHIKEKKND